MAPKQATIARRIYEPAFEQTRSRRSTGSLTLSCAAAGLLFDAVIAALALVILWDDGPPVIFRQMRVGRRGKLFRIWKFRTMRAGSQGSVVTAAGDGRVTRTGAVLRRYKLDELPQLFNVLKGDMGLVGPRPEVPEHVQLEAPIWQAILQVRPGVTDLASLLYRDEEKLLATSRDPNAFYRESDPAGEAGSESRLLCLPGLSGVT